MKKTSKEIRKEFATENEVRENKLALDLIDARQDAYINGNTDKLNKLLGLPTAYQTAYNDSLVSGYVSNNAVLKILDNSRDRVLSESEKVNLTELIKAEDKESLSGYKGKTLKALCKTFDLPTTGKKSVLIDRILDYVYSHTTTTQFKTVHDVFDYMVKSGYAVNLAKMIVRKISKGTTACAETCMNIVFNSYNDALFEDISQAIMLELWEMFKHGIVVFAGGKLVFREILKDENGHFSGYGKFLFDHESGKDSTFINLFSACRKCIESYKLDADSPKTEDIEIVNGFESADLLSALHDNESVINFMSYLKKEDEKNYPIYCGIIQALFEGTKQDEVAQDFSVNVRKIKYLTAKLYNFAKAFFQCAGEASVHTVKYIKLADKSGSVILKNDSGIYTESLTGKIIDINDAERYHATPKKGVRVYQTQYRIG